MADLRISDLVTASQLKNDDYYEISQSESGTRVSYKATLLAIAVQIATMVDFTSDLNTTSKKITGAINELKQLISLIPQFSIEVVQELPTEDISDTTIYLVPAEDPEVGNYYEEYIHVNNTWELVGTTAVDLSAYYTKLEVDGLLADKLEADDFEANQTASANPITLETKQAGLAKSCVVEMNPIQDLHGYDHPWAGGAGKNKFNDTIGTHTINANTDRTILIGSVDLVADTTYTVSCKQTPNTVTWVRNLFSIRKHGTSSNIYNPLGSADTIRPMTYTPSETATFDILVWGHTLSADTTYSDFQVEVGTQATTFAPYSNICPISGRTEASVNQGSVDITTLYNGQIQSTGAYTGDIRRICNVNNAQMNTYFLKKGTHTLTFNKLNQSAPDLVECTVLTKNDNFEIVDNFATAWHSLPYTFELTADAYVYFTARKNYETALNTADYKTLIIDEAHTKEFGQTVYGGILDLLNGKLTIEWLSKIITSVNSIGGSGTEASPYFFRILLSSSEIGVNTVIENNQPIASYFKPDNTSSHVLGGTFLTSNGGALHITFADQSIDTTAKANTYLTANPLQVAYKLAIPTTIQLSPEALTLLKGLNVISTDGDKVQVEFSDIPVGDYSALLDYVKSLEARIQNLES